MNVWMCHGEKCCNLKHHSSQRSKSEELVLLVTGSSLKHIVRCCCAAEMSSPLTVVLRIRKKMSFLLWWKRLNCWFNWCRNSKPFSHEVRRQTDAVWAASSGCSYLCEGAFSADSACFYYYTSSRSQETGCVSPALISGSSLQSSVSFFLFLSFVLRRNQKVCVAKKLKTMQKQPSSLSWPAASVTGNNIPTKASCLISIISFRLIGRRSPLWWCIWGSLKKLGHRVKCIKKTWMQWSAHVINQYNNCWS